MSATRTTSKAAPTLGSISHGRLRRARLGFAGVAAAVCASATALAQSVLYNGLPPPNSALACTPKPPTPAELASVQGQTPSCPPHSDARVRDVQVRSASLANDPVWVRLFLPPGWTPTKKWPVLYLLTGHGASYQSWSCDTFAEKYLAQTGVIVAMPDGSRKYDVCGTPPDTIGDSAIPGDYSDWVSPSNDANPEKWEQFHIVELQQILKNTFGASGVHAIAGLSMGGAGAFTYAARHPGMFVAAAAYSGGLNWISSWGFAAQNGALIAAGQDTNAPWGYYPGTPGAAIFGTHWPEHNPTSLAGALLGIPLFISAGEGTTTALAPNAPFGEGPIEVGARAMNGDFVSALTAANGGVNPPKLQTDFYEGTHTWAYWDAEFCKSLPMLTQSLGVTYVPTLPCNVPIH
jgi:diacylglycerol O-acyltransferase/trehalose O-mycolyltransferase